MAKSVLCTSNKFDRAPLTFQILQPSVILISKLVSSKIFKRDHKFLLSNHNFLYSCTLANLKANSLPKKKKSDAPTEGVCKVTMSEMPVNSKHMHENLSQLIITMEEKLQPEPINMQKLNLCNYEKSSAEKRKVLHNSNDVHHSSSIETCAPCWK